MKKQEKIPKFFFHQTQYYQIIRAFGIRYVTYLKEKAHPPQLIQQTQIVFAKIINQNDSKQVILTKILSLQLKGDYHQVIALTMMQDLVKWSRQYYNQTKQDIQQKILLETIIEQSTKLLNSQQQYHTIIPKQNDLLRQLLLMPHLINSSTIDNFRVFYRKLKDIKQFYPQVVKQNQKILFLKTIEECIELCSKYQSLRVIEFIFGNLFAQLQVLNQAHEYITSRLKLVKKIIKNLWVFHDEILYKASFLIMKFSNHILQLPHLFSSLFNLYEDLLPILIEKNSPAPLIIFNHLIINNLKKIIENKTINYFYLEILLKASTQIFSPPFISYFMKNYDANFLEQSVCQNSLNILFQFVENRANQRKFEYQIFKKYLKKCTDNIRNYLNDVEPNVVEPSQKLIKFYEVKKKQYTQIVQDMNEKPKKIFKKLESISNKDIKQQIIKKYVRIAKKSTHLENKKMIDIFAADNPVSQQLFAEYISLLFSNLTRDVNLQQFVRYFSSNFFLNGQSQQILRVLDKITVLFYHHQPIAHKILKNSDSTYTFANAILILNTDLHNPQNLQKMSVQSFYKICKKINNGQDLPTQMLNSTYLNIRNNKINTFRDKSSMSGISASNFVLICNKEQQHLLQFYDSQMRMLSNDNFYNFWIYDLLVGIIDERQTLKLQQLIQRFVYNDNSFECQIIELIRKLTKKKAHIPLHALQKILQHANFKNSRTSEKTISYLWLSVSLVQNFSSYLPTNVICQLLILTWRMRSQIKDDMHLRQKAQIKRVKKMIKEYQRRISKKSIMDMFSSFLTFKEEVSEEQQHEEFNMGQTNIKKMNHKVLTEKILTVLLKPSLNSKNSHRAKAIQFFISYLRNDEQKIFQEFISLLYLIFHLLYRFELHSAQPSKQSDSDSPLSNTKKLTSPKKKTSASLIQLSTQSHTSQQNISTSQFQDTIEDLLYQLLGLKQSSITKRIQNLKKKDLKKYQILQNYSYYWVLKILINKIQPANLISNFNSHQTQQTKSSSKQKTLVYLLNKSIQYIQKTDKQTYIDLVYEFEQKAKEVFSLSSQATKSKEMKQEELRVCRLKQKDEGDQKTSQIDKKQNQEILNENKQERPILNQVQQKENTKQNGLQVESATAQKRFKEQESNLNENKQCEIEIKPQLQNNYRQQNVQPNITGNQEKKRQENPKDQQNLQQEKKQENPKEQQNLQQKMTQQNPKNQQNLQQKLTQQNPKEQQNLEIHTEQHNNSNWEIIQTFIFTYRKLILQFYVNLQRIVGKEEINKSKSWKWLIQLQRMIKQVMQIHEERQQLREENRREIERIKEINKEMSEQGKQKGKLDRKGQTSQQKQNLEKNLISKGVQNQKNQSASSAYNKEKVQQRQDEERRLEQKINVEIYEQNKVETDKLIQRLSHQQIPLQSQECKLEDDKQKTEEDKLEGQVSKYQSSDPNAYPSEQIQKQSDSAHQIPLPIDSSIQKVPQKQHEKVHESQSGQLQINSHRPNESIVNPTYSKSQPQIKIQSSPKQFINSVSQQKLKLLQMIQQEEEQLKKLQELYSTQGPQSLLNMPFYML